MQCADIPHKIILQPLRQNLFMLIATSPQTNDFTSVLIPFCKFAISAFPKRKNETNNPQ